jgi:endoglucanase Acf2
MVKQLFFVVRFTLIVSVLFYLQVNVKGQFVPVGSGGYTTVFPGVDEAGRNTYPEGTPKLSGAAIGKPIPTNDWWSAKLNSNHVSNLFNYPYTLKTVNEGLVVSYIPWGVIDDYLPVTAGVVGLNASQSTISDYSDWTVTLEWNDGSHSFQAISGIGMPFLYFTKSSTDVAQVKVNSGNVTISDEMLIIANAHNNADFAVYAPTGSTWIQSGQYYTSDLNGENYWSMAFLPLTASNITEVANQYKEYAYVFPVNTITSWNYNETSSVVRTDFMVETDMKEGSNSDMLLGLLPHQWANLADDSPFPDQYSYETIRGEMKTLVGNTFSIENSFHGILPTLPYINYYSEGYSPTKQNEKIQLIENDGLATWTDSYNEGQSMNRLIQTARVADLIGNTDARDKIHTTVKARLEDWLLAEAGEVAFLFYYNYTWSALIGYPAGHGQDGNLNDHHFHWGYFIHAAAFVEQFEPGWAEEWGEMINYLVRDAACSTRTDELFPFLRNFSPYAGHCWANGFATFPQGNDQESTSESMQFNSSLIHWGTITGNDEIRDLGIYLYTTEQSAVEEYWFDIYERNFLPAQQYSLVSRVWGNSYDNGTFWTNDIAASYGIELYPIHGGSLYLGHHLDYVQVLWDEIVENTGISTNEPNDNLWHDVMWEYCAFIDPPTAIEMYDSYPERSLKYGISDAQTYHWLHAMNVLGNVDAIITADYPVAAAFNIEGDITYTAHNYSNSPISVSYSDGFTLDVPPNKMVTSKDITLSGVLSSGFPQAFVNGSVELSAIVSGGTPTKIQFFDGEVFLGEVVEEPFNFTATNLSAGVHGFYAKVFDGSDYNITNIASVIVGRQLPYISPVFSIPGAIEAGHYDKFEGGKGQGISYSDASVNNEGGFRPNEYVDALYDSNEGATIGWISTGEWLEYSIQVEEPGFYSLDFRYASDNDNGGGPFHLELDDSVISDPITVGSTGGWDVWATKTVNNIPLSMGEHILKLSFSEGEFNIGEMTFMYSSPLDYDQPVADAGENVVVVIPENSAMLDGSNSYDPENAPLSYQWTQIYGPSLIIFSDDQIAEPEISGLIEGYYLVSLSVSNGDYSDSDELYVIVSETVNIPPTVSISSPANNEQFIEGTEILIAAEASDMDGSILKVDFFVDNEIIGTDTEEPYTILWSAPQGEYEITAVATDNEELSTISQPITIIFTDAPPCEGTSSNGEFGYLFSPDNENPTLTFIPSLPGMGNPTCILYYGTNTGNLPGYYVTPNVPYQINASEGDLIYFYYTYSYPGQGEHNNSANPDTYLVGSCVATGIDNPAHTDEQVLFYPNPVTDYLRLQLKEGKNTVNVYNLAGIKIDQFSVVTTFSSYNMNTLEKGIYIFEIIGENDTNRFKIIKK